VLEELDCLDNIGQAAWDRLAEVVQDCSGSELQTAALLSARASAAFLTKRVFHVARGLPWKLAQGDVAANLEALDNSSDAVTDPTTAQIKSLLALGFNRTALADAVTLLREVPWSTLGVEQAHGSVACIHKLHRGCGVETITCRALLHQARHLFVPSPEAKAEEKAKAQLEKLRRSAKKSVSARNLFFKDFVAAVMPADADSAPAGNVAAREALLHSQKAFDMLDPSAARAYTNLAQQATLQRAKRLQEDIEHEAAARRLKQARAQEAAQTLGKTSHASNCRFGHSDFEAMLAELDTGKYRRAEVKASRAKCLEAPGPLTDKQLEVLDSFGVEPLAKELPIPEWAKVVCNHRDAFHGCVLLAASEDAPAKAYLVMYALKSPLTAMFLTLAPVAAKVRAIAGVPLEELQFKVASYYVHNFTYSQGAYAAAQELPFESDGADIFVLEDLSFMGGTWLCTNAPLVPFNVFTAHLPAPSKAKAEGSRKPAQRFSISKELLEQYPWLAEYLPQARGKASAASASNALAEQQQAASALGGDAFLSRPECKAEPGEAFTEESVDRAWAVLEEKRLEWANASTEIGDNFSVQLRGGGSSSSKAVPHESVVASAKAGAPRKWAETYHMGKQTSFAVKKYGAVAAHAMALEWCRKCEFFYQMWCSQSERNYMYTPADLASYDEGYDWTSFMADLDVDSHTWSRASQVMALQPRLA
jgi:hypothetical protein